MKRVDEAAVLNVFNATAAAGAVVVARTRDELLRPLGAYDNLAATLREYGAAVDDLASDPAAWWARAATTIPRGAGAALREALRDRSSGGATHDRRHLLINFTAAEVRTTHLIWTVRVLPLRVCSVSRIGLMPGCSPDTYLV